MGALQKLKAYFGMVPAEDYYDDEYFEEAQYDRYADQRPAHRETFEPRANYRVDPPAARDRDRNFDPALPRDRSRRGWAADQPQTLGALAIDPLSEPMARLRPVETPSESTGGQAKIVTLHPKTYTEARAIGEHYRDGAPVIINLTAMENADAKRLVDFAAGLAFALRGSMDKVANKVFLLSPPTGFSEEDRDRITRRGF